MFADRHNTLCSLFCRNLLKPWVWACSAWTYHYGLERSWQFDTTSASPFQQHYENIAHTFLCAFKTCSWLVGLQKKKWNSALPLYLCMDMSSSLSCALYSCLRLSRHNFLVQKCVTKGTDCYIFGQNCYILAKGIQLITASRNKERQPVHPLCLQMLGIPTFFHIPMLNHLLNLLIH